MQKFDFRRAGKDIVAQWGSRPAPTEILVYDKSRPADGNIF
jgi:hypothetical protein